MHVVKLKWAADEALPYEWDWPTGVPKDYTALAKDYEKFVVTRLKRHNKIKRNFEDILGAVWLRLIEVRVLHMFVEPTARTLPETMTVTEAIAFLGLDEVRWFLLAHRPKMRIKILSGTGLFDMKAAIATADVLRLDKACVKAGIERGRKVRPALTARGFRAYLERAIRNAYINYCRTQSRRYKEQLLCPQAMLSRQSSGVFRQVTELEGGSSWEANMAAAVVLDEESRLDLIREVRRSGTEAVLRDVLQRPLVAHYDADGAKTLRYPEVPKEAQERFDLAELLALRREDTKSDTTVLDLTRQGWKRRAAEEKALRDNSPKGNFDVLRLVHQGKSLGEAVKATVHNGRFEVRLKQRTV
jgi:DNA-directed RNA polymerase specialized sigma24 family protein